MSTLQRTEEWHKARIGKVTASNFGRVMTNAREKGKISSTARSYLEEILAGILTGYRPEFQTDAIQHGIDTEDEAVYEYEKRRFIETKEVGFLRYKGLNPLFEKFVGCSPDRLIGEDGLLEVKCPNTTTFVAYMMNRKIPKSYVAQMQGQMFVTGRKWCDYLVFDPRIQDPEKQMIVTRIERDEEFIEKLKFYLLNFCAELEFQMTALHIEVEDFESIPSV